MIINNDIILFAQAFNEPTFPYYNRKIIILQNFLIADKFC